MTPHRSWNLNPPLDPRNGRILRVVGVARISTEHQDSKSLADQEALYREWLSDHFGGEFELTMIASRGSGERLDSAELEQLSEHIDSGQIDLVLTEDLGRITRRIQAIVICEDCEDAGVRLIALNDNVDTFREDWRLNSMFASMRHESYNRDTGKRIRRTQRNRFLQGGQLRTPLFCYSKAPGAKSDEQLAKIPDMIPVVEEIFRRLEDGHSFAAIADWLNDTQVPCGRGAKVKIWKGPHVRNVVFNPILKGVRVHNRKILVRINKTGRRKAIVAPPEELLERNVPHLAFIEAARYDRIINKLRKQNAIFDVRRARGGDDPRAGRPKKRTRFPGQQVICGICNRTMVFGGNGRAVHLMCNGARERHCWNGSTFDAELAARRISEAVLAAIAELPDFEAAIRENLKSEAAALSSDRETQRRRIELEFEKNERAVRNIMDAIKTGGSHPLIQRELESLDLQRIQIAVALSELESRKPSGLILPGIEEIKLLASQAILELALEDPDFAILMKKLIRGLAAIPVRLPDGGYIETRLRFQLNLDRFVPADCRVPSVSRHLTREIVVDAFDPPERVRIYREVVSLRAAGMTERAVAEMLDTTISGAQRAARMHRIMVERGITDPYQPVTEPPSDLSKMTRHLHPRYRFNPLPPPEAA